jgi:hypothetical protein
MTREENEARIKALPREDLEMEAMFVPRARTRYQEGSQRMIKHLKEIRATKLVRPTTMGDALFHLGLAQGHRSVLLEAYDQAVAEKKALQDRLDSAECIIRQAAQDTFGREMTPLEFAEAWKRCCARS